VERPEERVAEHAKEDEADAGEPAAAAVIAVPLPREGHPDEDREEDGDVREQDDHEPRADDEATGADRGLRNGGACTTERVVRLPRLREAGGEEVKELSAFGRAKVPAVLLGEPREAALGVPESEAARGGSIRDGVWRLGVLEGRREDPTGFAWVLERGRSAQWPLIGITTASGVTYAS